MLRAHLAASFAGQGISALVNLLVIPFYLRLLGVEAFGLAAVFLSMQAVVAALDLGLAASATREIARAVHAPGESSHAQTILKTLQTASLGLAAVAALVLCTAGPAAAAAWLDVERLDTRDVRHATLLLGAALALRWPISLYAGVVRGAERHASLNAVIGVMSILKHGATAGVLAVSGTIAAFAWAQLLATMLEVVWLGRLAWRVLPAGPSRVDVSLVASMWRFSAGAGVAAVFAILLRQLDKLIIAVMLPLVAAGGYAAASLIPTGLGLATAPIAQTALPRFSRQDVSPETGDGSFHALSQLAVFIVAPIAALLISFPTEVLRAWTGSPVLATQATSALVWLSAAALLQAAMPVFDARLLARGASWTAAAVNGAAAASLAILAVVLAGRLGAEGAALAWAIVGAAQYLLVPQVAARVLHESTSRFYLVDTLPMMVASLGACAALRLLARNAPPWAAALAGVACFAGYVGVSVMCYSALRRVASSVWHAVCRPAA